MKLALLLGGLLVAIAVGASSLVLLAAPAPSLGSVLPSPAARQEIPAPILTLYREAASTCPGLPWTVLAAIGRRVCEQEWDLLELLAPEAVAAAATTPPDAEADDAPGLHGRPTLTELVAAAAWARLGCLCRKRRTRPWRRRHRARVRREA